VVSSSQIELHERPTWRGWLHAVTFLLAIPAGVFLILYADRAAARVGAAIYGACVLVGFGTSAAYHRIRWSVGARRVMQRLDHSMIFVLIAGTYTPVCLLALPTSWGIPLLCVVWTVAALGIVMKLCAFGRLRVMQVALYPILGWSVVFAAPVLIHGLTGVQLALLAAGGLLYTIGIPVLLVGRPDPWPRTFGYHEVWHAFTVAAGICHFATIGLLIR
jgi:hemolysin III